MKGPRSLLALTLVGVVLFGLCGEVVADRLAGYWGQNSAGQSTGPDVEAELGETCSTTEYDILIIAFLIDASSPGTLNTALHCTGTIGPYFRCPTIEEGIKQCQGMGKQVQLSIGGSTGSLIFTSAQAARDFANRLNDLFLSGTGAQNERPFGTAVLDGIDLDIEGGGSKAYYSEFVTELRSLMDQDTTKTYLITGAPQCPFPDYYLGDVLQSDGDKFDQVYVQFYNNPPCMYSASVSGFNQALDQWLDLGNSKNFGVFIGQPASEAAAPAGGYLSPDQLSEMYESVNDENGVGGIMLWDVSADQVNVIDGQRYSDYAFDAVSGVTPSTETPTTGSPTQSPTTPLTTTLAPVTTSSPVTPEPGCPSCETIPDGGVFAYPSDCTKYYECANGQPTEMMCPSGLIFNPSANACDWPENYECPVSCEGKDDGYYSIECDAINCYACSDETLTLMECTDIPKK